MSAAYSREKELCLYHECVPLLPSTSSAVPFLNVLCSEVSPGLRVCPPSPLPVRRCHAPLGVQSMAPDPISQGRPRDLPVPMQKVSRPAQGLRPPRVRTPLALSSCPVWPTDQVDVGGALDSAYFPGSIPGPPFPLSTLRPCPYEHVRMTRGQCGWLCLHRMELSPTTLCRSPGTPTFKLPYRSGLGMTRIIHHSEKSE
jgi:hypothetical protein